MALIDANGVYAAPRFFQAAKRAGIKALVGAEVVLEDEPSLWQSRARRGPLGLLPDPKAAARAGQTVRAVDSQARLTLLAADRTGYRNLSKLLTAAARGRVKGEARGSWGVLAEAAAGL